MVEVVSGTLAIKGGQVTGQVKCSHCGIRNTGSQWLSGDRTGKV